MKPTAAQKIVARLAEVGRPLMLHELYINGVSQTSASARLREMARNGVVRSIKVPGTHMTAWELTPKELILPL